MGCVGYPIDIPKIAFSKKHQMLPDQSCTVFDNGQAEGVEGHSSSNTDVSVEERHFWNHSSEIQIMRLGDNLVAVGDWRTRGQKKRLGWKCVNGVLRIIFIIIISVCLGYLDTAEMTTDTPSQSVGSRVMTFTPSKEEFKDFNQYIAYMESQGAHRAGMARVSPRDSSTHMCCQMTRDFCLPQGSTVTFLKC